MRRIAALSVLALLASAGCGETEPTCVPTCEGRVCGDDGCGGSCGECAEAEGCVLGACVPGSACDDGVRNGTESDVDCGGGCPACAAGKACVAHGDCASGACEGLICAPASGCDNSLKDGTEIDVDCGGGCAPCAEGKACIHPGDCASGACEGLICVAAVNCDNGRKDGAETDVDCGGGCPACEVGKACGVDADCASRHCSSGTCATPSCDDEVLNGAETDVDCGGGCPACEVGEACAQGADCATGVCLGGACSAPRAESQLSSGNDAVSSYLMDAAQSEWNIFHGTHVPLGRHFDSNHVSYHTALRFTGVQVPAGATITSAKLSFHPHNSVDSSNRLWINLYAERVADSAPFDPTNYETNRPDQRLKTAAFIDHWLVRCNATCTDMTEYDCPQRKLDCWDPTVEFTVPKDLKTLVQEVVDQPGWAAGNALTIFLINSATDQDGRDYLDHRTIVGHDPALGAQFSPRLVIDYQLE